MEEITSIVLTLLLLQVELTSKAQNGPPPPPPIFIITEIMYNPPETGADSLEFIEIVSNYSNFSIHNLQLVFGVDHIFPAGTTTNSNGLVIIAKDSVAFENTFGMPAYQWNSGSLLNTGETIKLINPYKTGDDSVAYANAFPWPSDADGQGHSLTLCETWQDNYTSVHWQASQNNTGIEVNGLMIYADPGELPNCLVGIRPAMEKPNPQTYPNPTNGGFTLSFPELPDDAIFSIHDSNGSLVHFETVKKGTSKLEKQLGLVPGVYLLELETDEKHQAQYLIVTK